MNFNNLHLYQIVILLIAGVMVYQGFYDFFRGKNNLTILKLAVRVTVWGGMAFVVLFPNFSNTLASIIGIEGNINAVILTGFIFVFLMIFKLLSAIERLEQQLTILTRKDSLSALESQERKYNEKLHE